MIPFSRKSRRRLALQAILGRIAPEKLGIDINTALPPLLIERKHAEIEHAVFSQLRARQLEHGLGNLLMVVIRHNATLRGFAVSLPCLARMSPA